MVKPGISGIGASLVMLEAPGTKILVGVRGIIKGKFLLAVVRSDIGVFHS